jgi:hypothetical protein
MAGMKVIKKHESKVYRKARNMIVEGRQVEQGKGGGG